MCWCKTEEEAEECQNYCITTEGEKVGEKMWKTECLKSLGNKTKSVWRRYRTQKNEERGKKRV